MDGKRPATGRIPLGLIGMIAMVMAVERGIDRRDLDVDGWQYQRARTRAAEQARGGTSSGSATA